MKRYAFMLVAVAALAAVKVASAQPGCTSTKAIICDGKTVCTTDEGSNCVTSPQQT